MLPSRQQRQQPKAANKTHLADYLPARWPEHSRDPCGGENNMSVIELTLLAFSCVARKPRIPGGLHLPFSHMLVHEQSLKFMYS